MRWFRRLSITARITIGSLIVATAFGAAAVIGVQIGVASILSGTTVTLLKHDTAPFGETLENHPGQAISTPGESQLIAVISPAGKVEVSTLPHSLRSKLGDLTRLDEQPFTVSTANADYMVLDEAFSTKDGVWQVVAARNKDSTDLVLSRLTVALIISGVVIVLAFGAASWILARTALQPVNSMRRQADRIAATGSKELLPVGPAEDELSALATTLNSLIGDLRLSADREKQLVSDASHELRTPLAVLQGELELAELDEGDATALLADLRSSRSAVLRLSGLATNLLELSRIEAATAQGHATWRELTAELADAIDRARLLLPPEVAAEVMVDFDYSPRGATDDEPSVALSMRDFGRVLDNLLGNAVAQVSAGDTVSAELVRDGDVVRLCVSDTGPGMPADFVPVAFDRFTRADTSRAARPGGGLGLAIVHALVTAADGTIALENIPGSGLRVRIELPVSPRATGGLPA